MNKKEFKKQCHKVRSIDSKIRDQGLDTSVHDLLTNEVNSFQPVLRLFIVRQKRDTLTVQNISRFAARRLLNERLAEYKWKKTMGEFWNTCND